MSKQSVLVAFLVILFLMANVLADRRFIDPHRRYKIATRPEVVTLEALVTPHEVPSHADCTLALDVTHHLRHRVEHSGFSVDQSVLLAAGDRSGIERLVQYMVRCPFSLSRLVKVTDTGQVAYKAEKDACQVFPDPQADNLEAGAKRNFQILSPLDFLAEFTQHIPPKGSHTIRYFGFYCTVEIHTLRVG